VLIIIVQTQGAGLLGLKYFCCWWWCD